MFPNPNPIPNPNPNERAATGMLSRWPDSVSCVVVRNPKELSAAGTEMRTPDSASRCVAYAVTPVRYSTLLHAFTTRSAEGLASFSSPLLYGIGTSACDTRTTGASR